MKMNETQRAQWDQIRVEFHEVQQKVDRGPNFAGLLSDEELDYINKTEKELIDIVNKRYKFIQDTFFKKS